MARMKPLVIDGAVVEVADKPGTMLGEVVAPDVKAVTLPNGQLVPRSAFNATPLPAGFESHWSTVSKGGRAL